MLSGADEPIVHEGGWRGRRLAGALPVDTGRGPDGASVLRVTIVGPDAEQRRRLAEVLAGAAGVEVAGWADSPRSLAVMGSCELAVVVPERATSVRTARPRLSPRQRDVLIAYAAGNELLDVVARRTGMNPETLKTHLRRIRAKYREVGRPAPTRRDLYVRAVEDGLLPPPS
jgi:DNA-binding CsgD family transcriptional regulator